MELLVVISIVGILVGLLLPALSMARTRASKVACMANLRQVGVGIDAYVHQNKDYYPKARYMPPPFVSASADPSLNTLLNFYLDQVPGQTHEVYHCPSDGRVFAMSGMSYSYQPSQGGVKFEDFILSKHFNLPRSEVVLSRDFDGGTFDIETGQITVDAFHVLRNLLFADGHVGNFEVLP